MPEVQISARTITVPMFFWSLTAVTSLVLLVMEAFATFASSVLFGSRLTDGVVMLLALVLCALAFAVFLRTKASISTDEVIVVRDPWIRELWRGWGVLAYGWALVPVGMGLALLASVHVAAATSQATFDAKASIASGTQEGSTVTTWRLEEDDDAHGSTPVMWSSGQQPAAPVGSALDLTGAWDGGTQLTISSVRTQSIPNPTALPGSSATSSITCVVIRGSVTSSDGEMPGLMVFPADEPGDGRFVDGEPARRFTLLPHGLCQESIFDGRESEMEGGARAGNADGSWGVAFDSDFLGSLPAYLGVASPRGAVIYFEVG